MRDDEPSARSAEEPVREHPTEANADAAVAAARRARAAAAIARESGIDEALIGRLVRRFYGRIQKDRLLGPIFAERVADWDAHLMRMDAFWSSVVLASGRYAGQPVPAHLPLPVDARHFDHWLALFEEVVREVCPPATVERFLAPARRIAASLELAIAARNGVLLKRDQRYVTPA